MTFGMQAVTVHQERLARAVDTGTMGEMRSSGLSGSGPDQWVFVHQGVLTQYQETIASLEQQVRQHRTYVANLMAQQGYVADEMSADPSEKLDAASTALVNSLLCTVADDSYYRDEEAE